MAYPGTITSMVGLIYLPIEVTDRHSIGEMVAVVSRAEVLKKVNLGAPEKIRANETSPAYVGIIP